MLTGLLFLFLPSLPVELFGLPEAPLGWLRVVGTLALIIAAYDHTISRSGSVPLLGVRGGFTIAIPVALLFSELPATAYPFTAVDLAEPRDVLPITSSCRFGAARRTRLLD